MKKAFSIILCLCLMASLAGCQVIKEFVDKEPAPSINIPNPLVQVESAKDFEKLGIVMDAPQGANNVGYSIIANKIAQVVFRFGENTQGANNAFTYRGAKSTEDISGIHYDLTPQYQIELASDEVDLQATVYTAENAGALVKWAYDGISYSLWCEGEYDDDTLQSAVTGVMARTFTVTPAEPTQPTPPPVMELVTIEPEKEYNIDLNGDGTEETVIVNMELNQYGDGEATLYVQVGEDLESVKTGIVWDVSAYAKDFDGDGIVEIFISGDYASNDYSTWCCRLVGKQLVLAEPAYTPDYPTDYAVESFFGRLESIEDGYVVVGGAVDVLGTHWGTTKMVLAQDEFRFIKDPNTPWTLNFDIEDDAAWEYAAIKTAVEFPVRMDGTGEAATLPIGTVIGITEINNTGTGYDCRFVIKDTLEEGVIAVDEIWNKEGYTERFINGMEEWECFEVLYYAG